MFERPLRSNSIGTLYEEIILKYFGLLVLSSGFHFVQPALAQDDYNPEKDPAYLVQQMFTVSWGLSGTPDYNAKVLEAQIKRSAADPKQLIDVDSVDRYIGGWRFNLDNATAISPLHALSTFTLPVFADTAPYQEMVQVFLKHGVDINQQTKGSKDTALHLLIWNLQRDTDSLYSVKASKVNKEEFIFSDVEFLVKNGASLDIKNADGFTPVELAKDAQKHFEQEIEKAKTSEDKKKFERLSELYKKMVTLLESKKKQASAPSKPEIKTCLTPMPDLQRSLPSSLFCNTDNDLANSASADNRVKDLQQQRESFEIPSVGSPAVHSSAAI